MALLAIGAGILVCHLTRPDPPPHVWEERIVSINDINPNIFILGEEINMQGLNHTRIASVFDVTYRTRPFAFIVINNWNGDIAFTQSDISHLRYLSESHSFDILFFGNSVETILKINDIFELERHPSEISLSNQRSAWIRPLDLVTSPFSRFVHVAIDASTITFPTFWRNNIIDSIYHGMTHPTLQPVARVESTRP